MSSFIRSSRKWKRIYRDRKQIGGCLGKGRWHRGVTKGHRKLFWGGDEYFYYLNCGELYALNICSLLYVDRVVKISNNSSQTKLFAKCFSLQFSAMPVKLSWGTQVRNIDILVGGLLHPLSSSYLPHPKGRHSPSKLHAAA